MGIKIETLSPQRPHCESDDSCLPAMNLSRQKLSWKVLCVAKPKASLPLLIDDLDEYRWTLCSGVLHPVQVTVVGYSHLCGGAHTGLWEPHPPRLLRLRRGLEN